MAANGGNRLDSWKDIAQHLGRDLSTVRRWEKDRGLPVHRIPGAGRSAVFAFTDEIDAWLAGQPSDEQTQPKLSIARFRMVASVLAGLALGLVGFTLWRGTAPNHISHVELQGNRLAAMDASGKTVWTYEFDTPLEMSAEDPSHRFQIGDIDGDGAREVVAGIRYANSEEEEAYCFSEDGALLWRFRLTLTVQFGEETFTGPWRIRDILVQGDKNDSAVWIAFVHHTWWPSFVVRISPAGAADLRFASAGWVTELDLFRSGSGNYIVAAGLNNEYEAGAVAILNPAGPPASSPQTAGSPYECATCPQVVPYRYFVFPRSELNALTGNPANIVRQVRTMPGQLEIRTEEINDPSIQSFGVYELSGDFVLTGASMTDLYWDLHRRLELEGKLPHDSAACRQQSMKDRVRVWYSDGKEEDRKVADN